MPPAEPGEFARVRVPLHRGADLAQRARGRGDLLRLERRQRQHERQAGAVRGEGRRPKFPTVNTKRKHTLMLTCWFWFWLQELRLELAEKQDVMQSIQETAGQLCQENHPAKQTVEVNFTDLHQVGSLLLKRSGRGFCVIELEAPPTTFSSFQILRKFILLNVFLPFILFSIFILHFFCSCLCSLNSCLVFCLPSAPDHNKVQLNGVWQVFKLCCI